MLVVYLWGGRGPARDPNGQAVVIDGDGNAVIQHSGDVQITVVRQQISKVQTEPRREGPDGSNDDALGLMVGLLAIAVGAALLSLVAMPLVVPVLLGASIAASLVAVITFLRTPSGAGPRLPALALAVGQLATVSATLWMRSQPLVGGGINAEIRALARELPGFSAGVQGRWETITTSTSEVLTVLGRDGISMVLCDLAAITCCTALLTSIVHG